MPEAENISYDLVREPWIPCERPDGTRALVGIEVALVEAHTFAALHDESPLVTAMLHRLLLAILQRVFAPRTMEDWVALWEAEAFDAGKVRAYLAKWRERFDLFHPERPFLQVANLREVLRTERGSDPEPTLAWRLAMESSRHSEGAMNLFESLPPEADLAPARAARALLGYMAFTPGGRIQNEAESWKGGPLRPGAVTLVRGSTLRRTLLCNLLWLARRNPEDVPPWERDLPTQRVVRSPAGPIDLLIWPSRRVELLAEHAGGGGAIVRKVITAAGERMDADVPDPMFAYAVRDPKKPPLALRVDPERSVWRDAAALFDAATGAGQFRRPAACSQVAELVDQGILPRAARLDLEVLGLASDQASISLWRAERVPLPAALLTDPVRVATLRKALELAEELGRKLDYDVLGALARSGLAPGSRDVHKDDVQRLKQALGAMPVYWAALGQAFVPWLSALGEAADLDPHLAAGRAALRRTARDVAREAALRLGTGARALQAGAKAERALRRVLREVLGAEDGDAATTTDEAREPTTEGAAR
jgi:CRISPR system Cascade subunit CasA